MVLNLGITVLFVVTLFGIMQWLSATKNSEGAVRAMQIFLSLYYYWASQVVSNASHITLCGLFGTFYFMGVSNGDNIEIPLKNPTAKSAKRAMTTSFGSNCYGSLLIAIISTLRSLANSGARNENGTVNFLACCLACILSYLQDILEYFNKYAFAQVAIYGKDYCSAGKDTWKLFKERGIDAIINDLIIGRVLGVGALIIAIINTLISLAYLAIAKSTSPLTMVAAGIIAFIVGIMEFSVIHAVFDSGVVATFTCL
jgi:hypothetical protein